MEDYKGAAEGATIIDAGTGQIEGGKNSSQSGKAEGERRQVIDLNDNQIRGGEASFQGQQVVRQAVDVAQAGGRETEIAALQVLDKDLRELRTEAALKAREADQKTTATLESRQPAPKVRKGWFSR